MRPKETLAKIFADLTVPGPLTARQRPVRGGWSIGHIHSSAQTLGCLVADRSNPNTRYILGSNLMRTAKQGDQILQPGPLDGGEPEADVVATLDRWVRPEPNSEKNLDAFLGRVGDRDAVSTEIEGIGRLKGVSSPDFNMRVMKVGRTTGLTSGEITLLSASINVQYDDNLILTFDDVIGTNVMSAGGDSGAILVNEDRRAVGILFAGGGGGGDISFYFPIERVLDALRVSLILD